MEETYFVCTNKNCNSAKGGQIIQIPENYNGHINCPVCNQKYQINEDKSIFTEFDETLVFESLSNFNEWMDKYANYRLLIKKLLLTGITDSENFAKTLSYKSCFIQDLMIENIDLVTPCFPLSFDECTIDRVAISNCRIKEDDKKDFWGPNTFYGINFNNTKISQQLDFHNFDGDLMFRACSFPEKVILSDCNVSNLSLLSNSTEPNLELKNSIIGKKHFAGKHKGSEETARLESLENHKNLKVKDTGKDPVIISNLHIGYLIFPETDEFLSAVKISNCTINNLDILTKNFNQSIEFWNCHFINPVKIRNINFKHHLFLEANYFEEDVIFNEVNIAGDLHLSFSTFAQNLTLNHTNVYGYFTGHHVLFTEQFSIERGVFQNNMTIVNAEFGTLLIDNCEFKNEVFLNSCKVLENTTFNYTNINGGLDFSRSYLTGPVSVNNTTLDGIFRCSDSYFANYLNLIVSELRGDFLTNMTTFIGDVHFILSKISACYILSSSFSSDFMIKDGRIEKTTRIINNIFTHQFILFQLILEDHVYLNNIFLEKLDLDKLDGKDIELESNKIAGLFLNNVVCGRIESQDNSIGQTAINELVCNKAFLTENCSFSETTSLSNSRFLRTVFYKNCLFENTVKTESCSFGDSLIFENDNLNADFTLVNNEIASSIQLISTVLRGKTEIIKNHIGQELEVQNLHFNFPEENDEQEETFSFDRGLWIRNNNMHNLLLKQIKGGAPLYCEKNLITGNLELGNNQDESVFMKPVSISRNRMRAMEIEECRFDSNFCFFINHIEGGFTFANSKIAGVCDFSSSYVGGSAIFLNLVFNGNLILDDSFFDKRLDFRDCNANSVSFRAATLHGFSMPSNWRMTGGRLYTQEKESQPLLIDEKILLQQNRDIPFTFQMASSLILSNSQKLKTMKKNWRVIKSTLLSGEEDLEQQPEELVNLIYFRPVIDQLLIEEFYPMFYRFLDQHEVESLKSIIVALSKLIRAEDIKSRITPEITEFCEQIGPVLFAFDSVMNEENSNNHFNEIKPILYERLQDQYLVIKEIYGGNGELGDEDRAYFRWMHYKNLFDFQISNWHQKPAKIFKWLVFENIFGWGVDLFRIFGSTILLVLLFSGVYWVGGQVNPGISIRWDDLDIPISMMSYGKILLLTFQTTFAAFMGDWSPAGLGPMKVWMTINAVLGVLLVAFLIGAYGRKMLR